MAIVEIHIKDNEIELIEGNGVYVFVHDHDINETTTMIFKHQKEEYDNSKNNGHSWTENVERTQRQNKIGSRIQIDTDEHF